MQSFPAHFTWLEEQPIVCIIDAEYVEAVNRAYEEDGEVELVDSHRNIAIEMPDYHLPQQVILIGPGGETSHGAGTGAPWESFCWYARPLIVQVMMYRSGPCTGAYQVCRVRLRAMGDQKPRTWWGYKNGYSD